MSDVPFFGGGDFLRSMLGDLVKMMPQGPGLQWQLAYQVAAQISAGGDLASNPPGNPDPIERIRLEELSSIAELHVAGITGMPVSPTGEAVRLVPASRYEWSRRVLDMWRPVLDKLAAILTPDLSGLPGMPGGGTGEGTGLGDLDAGAGAGGGFGGGGSRSEGDDGESGGMEALLGQWAAAMFPAMTAWQIGSVAGHLSEWAVGQYDVPLSPAPGNELLVCSENVAEVASAWSLPIDDLRLWLCAQEMAFHTALSRPAIAGRLAELVVKHAEQVRPDVSQLGELMQHADLSNPAALAELMSDPSVLSPSGEAAEATERIRAELDALTAALSGYVSHVTSHASKRLMGNTGPISEAMRRRRVGRSDGERSAEALFGLSLDQAQVDRGAGFVAGVLERSGENQLARMWADASMLPTPAEVDAPGLWLARLDLAPGGGA